MARTVRSWLSLLMAVSAAGCSVYDNSLLGGTSEMVSPGDGGGTGGISSGRDASSGGGGTLDANGSGGSTPDYCLGEPRVTYPPRPTDDEVSDAAGNDITLTG